MHYVYAYLDPTSEEATNQVTSLFSALRNVFEVGGDTIGRRIVRTLFAKARDPFIDAPGRAQVSYVEELRRQYSAKEASTVKE